MRSWGRLRWLPASVVLGGAAAAAVAFGTSSRGVSQAVGRPPPEWAKNACSWPSHNAGLANRRANLDTEIDSHDVHELKQRWTFALPYKGGFGAFTSNPIVLGGVVYLEDPDSTVFALSLKTGKPIWTHAYRSMTPSGGPNGVAYGYRLLFGATEDSVLALRPGSGKQVWIRKLAATGTRGSTWRRSSSTARC